MSRRDRLINEIKTQRIGNSTKRALIVEGQDDVDVFTEFLRKKNPDWEQTWVIAAAGGKKMVLDVLDVQTSWLGVIDRDEWSPTQVDEVSRTRSNLHVLPRFCIESYLIDPAEIWYALPEIQQSKLTNGQQTLRERIEGNLAAWIRHAALWQVIHTFYMGIRDSQNRDRLLDPANVPNRDDLISTLNAWLPQFKPELIAQQISDLEAAYQNLPKPDLYAKHLYAKKFFPMVVHVNLNALLGQKTEKDRIQDLLRTLPLPDDLNPLWQKMNI